MIIIFCMSLCVYYWFYYEIELRDTHIELREYMCSKSIGFSSDNSEYPRKNVLYIIIYV